jgi:UDP-N-acetylmuramate: L-alanyl-gamma-D-glutamyl-meso-diaminopimelate ligase
LYEQTKNKTRVVIGGSHGKTTITSMILHVLNYAGINHDYMVGAQLEGFDCMVKLSEDAPIAIFEGDEYLSSPIDRRPKFHLYFPNIALLSGIAWDHINVFPTFDNYVDQFRTFLSLIEANGTLVYSTDDAVVKELAAHCREDIALKPYSAHPHKNVNGEIFLLTPSGEIPVKIFGTHNLQNLSGALEICRALQVSDDTFFEAIASFSGASRRMELIKSEGSFSAYRDFAHSPSKLKATIQALREKNPDYMLTACFELHTFSSLNKSFLEQYADTMMEADRAIVFYSPDTIEHKKLPPISVSDVKTAFNRFDLEVYCNNNELVYALESLPLKESNLLMMSSGNFHGLNLNQVITEILN